MRRVHRGVLLAPLALTAALVAVPARASVVSSGPAGFVVREEVQFAGPPAAAWKHLVDVASWWDPKHTYSGSSSNLSIALSPGGCWCEKLANGGFARHLEVVLANPNKTLRLTGGLGPLQGIGATGALTFTLRSGPAGATTVVAEYSVVGYSQDGLASLAATVDGVLAEQMARFARDQEARP
jgi:hypothetical protein